MLIAFATLGWWWSARMAAGMGDMGSSMPSGGMGGPIAGSGTSVSFAAFLLAWVAMMAAMMFPAIVPVVRLYARAARGGSVAPTPVFVTGYLVVWAAVGAPAWFAWQVLHEPLSSGAAWAVRLSGGALLVAALYQLTPLKSACLRHCRSPLGFFLTLRGNLRRPLVACRAGLHHGLWCLGCCWAVMLVLVAVGTMHLLWMAALAVLILLEKTAPGGVGIGRVAALAFAVAGVGLLVRPDLAV